MPSSKGYRDVVKHCLVCGEVLTLRNNRDIERKKYCSLACRSSHSHTLRKVYNTVCECCGESFTTTTKTQTTCSNSCYYRKMNPIIPTEVPEGNSVPFGDGYHVFDNGRIWKEDETIIRSDGVERFWQGSWVPTRIREGNKGNGGGYEYVDLRVDNKQKTFLVHRVVAMCFLPNHNDLPQVNHKDGVRDNNCVDNLEWVTASENQIHAFKYLRNK